MKEGGHWKIKKRSEGKNQVSVISKLDKFFSLSDFAQLTWRLDAEGITGWLGLKGNFNSSCPFCHGQRRLSLEQAAQRPVMKEKRWVWAFFPHKKNGLNFPSARRSECRDLHLEIPGLVRACDERCGTPGGSTKSCLLYRICYSSLGSWVTEPPHLSCQLQLQASLKTL